LGPMMSPSTDTPRAACLNCGARLTGKQILWCSVECKVKAHGERQKAARAPARAAREARRAERLAARAREVEERARARASAKPSPKPSTSTSSGARAKVKRTRASAERLLHVAWQIEQGILEVRPDPQATIQRLRARAAKLGFQPESLTLPGHGLGVQAMLDRAERHSVERDPEEVTAA
jgi:hypothetical protein